MAVALGSAGVMTVLLGVTSGPVLVSAVFLQPLLAVCFFPVGFAALSRVSPLGVSLAVPAAMLLGGGAIPALIGAMAEAGWGAPPVAFSATWSVATIIVSVCLRSDRLPPVGPLVIMVVVPSKITRDGYTIMASSRMMVLIS